MIRKRIEAMSENYIFYHDFQEHQDQLDLKKLRKLAWMSTLAPNFLKSFVNLLVTDSLANLSKVLRGNKN